MCIPNALCISISLIIRDNNCIKPRHAVHLLSVLIPWKFVPNNAGPNTLEVNFYTCLIHVLIPRCKYKHNYLTEVQAARHYNLNKYLPVKV